MLKYNICHCGRQESDHYCKHKYHTTTTVKKIEKKLDFKLKENTTDIIIAETTFYINCLDFNLEEGIKCSVNSCKALKSLHKTQVIEHEFQPAIYKFRTIRFYVPEETVCNKCPNTLTNHENVMTHHFTTKIIFEDINESDKVIIINPVNEDKKIIY